MKTFKPGQPVMLPSGYFADGRSRPDHLGKIVSQGPRKEIWLVKDDDGTWLIDELSISEVRS